jgi:3-oxoacyl-[acyl-carrier-protein] synthase-1
MVLHTRDTRPFLPVHCWDEAADEALPALRFAGKGSMLEGSRACMSNSFAFGGCNTSLILGFYND